MDFVKKQLELPKTILSKMSSVLKSIKALRNIFEIVIVVSLLSIILATVMAFLASIQDTNSEERREFHQLQKRFPKCLIVGAMKCGTKALIEFLAVHPDIRISGKEEFFFDEEENYSKGFEYYRQQMPYSYPGDITIETTPSYFTSNNAMQRIRSFNKDMKIIIMLCNPIKRTMSHFLQLKRKGIASVDRFEDYVIDPSTGEVKDAGIIKTSKYAEYVSQWYSLFPRNQVLILPGDHFAYYPVKQLKVIEAFLGLKHWVSDLDFYYDRQKGFYCTQLAGCLTSSKGHKHPPIDPKVLEKLKAFFEPYDKQLAGVSQREVSWKYN